MNSAQKEYTMKNVIDRIDSSGMETACFYSVQRDEIYVKVRCPPLRLRQEAARIDYQLLLDRDRLRVKAQSGKKNEDRNSKQVWKWKGISITDEQKQSPLNPYDFIYAPYKLAPDLQNLYTQYQVAEGMQYPFKPSDRIKLMVSIMQARVNEEYPGAGLDLLTMKEKRVTKGQFPVHDYEQLNMTQKKWLVLLAYPWAQPLDEIKEYFGERIAFYFLYLQHYVTFLTVPCFIGIPFFITEMLTGEDVKYILDTVFCAIMLVWSTMFVEFWKRLQSRKCMEWGMSDFESLEQNRPLFDGDWIKSPIDGKDIKYFSSSKKAYIQTKVQFYMTIALTVVMMCVTGVFYFQYWINIAENKQYLSLNGTFYGNNIVGVISALNISILNFVYQFFANRWNDEENHQTETKYEDSLISKVFTFQLINSFAALTYVSFLKPVITTCIENDCIGEVQNTISTIFITQLVTRILKEVFLSMYMQKKKEDDETDGIEPGKELTPLEMQSTKTQYDPLKITLQDYAALVIQFGFCILFVTAFPLAPALSFLSSYIQIRVDGWKFCQSFQRPEPKSAQDIGVWQIMLEFLSYIAIVYNFGLLFFTSKFLIDVEWSYRWFAFVAAQNIAFGMKSALAELMEDTEPFVEMQLQRQEFLVSKVIYDKSDDLEPTENQKNTGKTSNIIIEESDEKNWMAEESDDIDKVQVGIEDGEVKQT
jgi:hypothetical protein